jgi:SPASM domain peptide maturase of grasp-with-spasm system
MSKCFVLYSCCIPVRGASRSTICDLQRSGFIFIPNDFYDFLQSNNLRISSSEWNKKDFKFKKLVQNIVASEYGFFCDDPDEFPPLDTTFEMPNLITNAVIDVGEEPAFDLNKLVLNLNKVNCFLVYIRIFGDSALPQRIADILEMFRHSTVRNIQVEIVSSNAGMNHEELLSLNKIFPRFRKVIVRNSSSSVINRSNTFESVFLKSSGSQEDDCGGCGMVSPFNFSTNYQMFFESMNHNNCLNKKIAIGIEGLIRNCPYHPDSFVHIDSVEDLSEFVKNSGAFKTMWDVSKDQVEECRDCEFRYICQDCRVYTKDRKNLYSKPASCKYNPYEGVWAAN